MAKFTDELTKILESFTDQVRKAIDPSNILDQLKEVDTAASAAMVSFGVGRDNIQAINVGLTEAVTKVTLLGGSFNDVAKIQQAVSKDLGRNVILTSETVEKLFATTKVTGQSTETLSKNFKDIGYSAGKISEQMDLVVNSARAIGVNAQKVSEQAVANLSSMNKFNFQGGVEGLSKMAAQAVSLRVDMKETLSLSDKLFDPEQAINMAAGLQRLGVTQSELLDPLRLMDLSQNDPTELQNQIAQMTKQFVKLKEDGSGFEIMKGAKNQLREIAKEMNIPYETLTNMALAGSELDDKFKKIKFPKAFDEEQKQFIANLAEMDKNGEYKIQVGTESLGLDEAMAKFEETPELLQKMLADQGKTTMEKLADEQLSTLKSIEAQMASLNTVGYGAAGSKTGVDMMQVAREGVKVAGAGARALNPLGATTKQQRNSVDLLYKSLDNIVDGLTGKESLEDVLKNLGKTGTIIENQINTNLQSTANQASTSLGNLAKSGNQFYETIRKFLDKGTSTNTEPRNLSTQKVGAGDINQTKPEIKVSETKGPEITNVTQNETVSNGGVDLNKSVNTPPQASNVNGDINITLTHNINGAPSNIDITQLAQMMTNSDITQTLIKEMKRTLSDNGIASQFNNNDRLS